MTTPLTASYRVQVDYTVDTLPHKMHFFCHLVPGSGASGFDLDNSNISSIDAKVAIEYFLGQIGAAFVGGGVSTFDTATLQQLVGSNWVPLYVWTPTSQPTGGGTYVKAGQITMTTRDSAYHKVKHVFLETNVPVGLHSRVGSTGVGSYSGSIHPTMTTPGSSGHINGWDWIRGRSNLYVASFTAVTTDLNNRLRRARHIN